MNTNKHFFHLVQEMLQNICVLKEKVCVHAQYTSMPASIMMFKNGTTEYNIDDVSYDTRVFILREGKAAISFTAHDISLMEFENSRLHIYLK